MGSNYQKIDIGDPQGTVLGLLLFLLYMNDLLENLSKDAIPVFADDTALISKDKTWIMAIETMVI